MATKKNQNVVEQDVVVEQPQDVVVVNPVLICMEITRTSGTDKDRHVITYDPAVIVAREAIPVVMADLTSKMRPVKDASKTSKKYVVMATDTTRNSVPVIADASTYHLNYVLATARAAKRKALKSIPAETRALIGVPNPDASDAVIDAWTPATGVAASQPVDAPVVAE